MAGRAGQSWLVEGSGAHSLVSAARSGNPGDGRKHERSSGAGTDPRNRPPVRQAGHWHRAAARSTDQLSVGYARGECPLAYAENLPETDPSNTADFLGSTRGVSLIPKTVGGHREAPIAR